MQTILLNNFAVTSNTKVTQQETGTIQPQSDNQTISYYINNGYAFWIAVFSVLIIMLCHRAITKMRDLKKYGPKSIRWSKYEDIWIEPNREKTE